MADFLSLIQMESFEDHQRCEDLSKPSIPQFVVSCCLMGWLLICYIPQWGRIIARQSAEGLSTLYILLGSLSGICAVGNILVLPASQVDIGCCRENTSFACISGLLGIIQVVSGIVCFWVVLFLYVYYSEEEADAELKGRRESLASPDRTFRRARRAWIILCIVVAFAFTILLVSAIILHRFPWVAQNWANVLGIAVAVFACVQWVPQVWTTIHLGHLGSLSPLSICLSAPYTWIFGINMMIRVGIAGWSSWIVYVLVGVMQVILIITAIVFAVRDHRKHQAQGRKDSVVDNMFNAWAEEGGKPWQRRNSIISTHRPESVRGPPDERSSLLSSRR